MSVRVRQLIFFFVLLSSGFGLVSLLFYSAGYGINLKKFELVPTGSIRISVQSKEDALIFLLPEGGSLTSSDASFTHLLPGEYRLHVELDQYNPINLQLTVAPNSTLIIDPLYLWPIQEPVHSSLSPVLAEPKKIADLDIALQSAISELGIHSSEMELLTLSDQDTIILDKVSGIVHLLESTGQSIQTRNLGSAKKVIASNNTDTVLLVSEFSLQSVNIHTTDTETILRISQPINDALWLVGTPYITYSIGSDIHIIDSRQQTNFNDQLVAQLPLVVEQIQYLVDDRQLLFVLSDASVYTWSIDDASTADDK